MDFNNLSLREKIGQKFILGVNTSSVSLIVDLIEKCCIGGVILYKNNYSSYDEMLSVIKRFKKANSKNKIPLFIAIDQEGGRVNRMPLEFLNLKNIYDMSRKNEDLILEHAKVTGKMLKESGINMNFAPVLDIYNNKSKLLYKRCFYGDVSDVYRNGLQYVEGLTNNGIVSVVKHFPGHGATSIDSHFLTPYVYDYKKILESHILPFEKAIKNNNYLGLIDAVMVNHMVVRKLTNGLPASISYEFISEYLRKRNNFDGLVITDEMNMLSKNLFYKFGGLKKMFTSGSDILLVKIKNKNDAEKMIDKYIKYVSNDEESMNLLNDSVKRIIRVKNKYDINDDINYDGCNVDEINKEIEKINRLCLVDED